MLAPGIGFSFERFCAALSRRAALQPPRHPRAECEIVAIGRSEIRRRRCDSPVHIGIGQPAARVVRSRNGCSRLSSDEVRAFARRGVYFELRATEFLNL